MTFSLLSPEEYRDALKHSHAIIDGFLERRSDARATNAPLPKSSHDVLTGLLTFGGCANKSQLSRRLGINSGDLDGKLLSLVKSDHIRPWELALEPGRGKKAIWLEVTESGFRAISMEPSRPGPLHRKMANAVASLLSSNGFAVEPEVLLNGKRVDVLGRKDARSVVAEIEVRVKDSVCLDTISTSQPGIEVFIITPNEIVATGIEGLLRKDGVLPERVVVMPVGRFLNGGFK